MGVFTMQTDAALANDNDAPLLRVLTAEETFTRCVVAGLMTADEAARLIEDERVPGAIDRYQGWIIAPDGRRVLVFWNDQDTFADSFIREAIEAGLGRIGYVTRNGRLLRYVTRSRALKLKVYHHGCSEPPELLP
jgi:hypothetical protein